MLDSYAKPLVSYKAQKGCARLTNFGTEEEEKEEVSNHGIKISK